MNRFRLRPTFSGRIISGHVLDIKISYSRAALFIQHLLPNHEHSTWLEMGMKYMLPECGLQTHKYLFSTPFLSTELCAKHFPWCWGQSGR